jgi:hypothetical protein
MKKAIWTITEASALALKLEPGKNDLIRFDTKLPGFGVRVRRLDSGAVARSYVYQYKIGGKHYRDRLGHVGGITAKRAREMAEGRHQKLKDGINPKEAQRAMHARSAAPTLHEATKQYLAAMTTLRRENTLRGVRSYLKGWLGKFGERALDEITPREAAAYLATIDGDAAANRACISLSALYVWSRATPLLHQPSRRDREKAAE